MENTERKLNEVIHAIIDGTFVEYDFNDQDCGCILAERLLAESQVGDSFKIYASPNSCRECASGEYTINIIDRINGQENWYTDFTIKIEDYMGNIGSYPNFEKYQNYDCSGTYIVRLLVDGQFQINPETSSFDLEKVRRRCRDALNKSNNPTIILNLAGLLNVKVF